MLPLILLPDMIRRDCGFGPGVSIPNDARAMQITLGITHMMERESLDVAVWGSSDDAGWGAKPLVHFPQKSYCGTYSLLLDLTSSRAIRSLRVEYKLNRWGADNLTPLFSFYVMASIPVCAAAAGALA